MQSYLIYDCGEIYGCDNGDEERNLFNLAFAARRLESFFKVVHLRLAHVGLDRGRGALNKLLSLDEVHALKLILQLLDECHLIRIKIVRRKSPDKTICTVY